MAEWRRVLGMRLLAGAHTQASVTRPPARASGAAGASADGRAPCAGQGCLRAGLDDLSITLSVDADRDQALKTICPLKAVAGRQGYPASYRQSIQRKSNPWHPADPEFGTLVAFFRALVPGINRDHQSIQEPLHCAQSAELPLPRCDRASSPDPPGQLHPGKMIVTSESDVLGAAWARGCAD
jgi:hypothetical protein